DVLHRGKRQRRDHQREVLYPGTGLERRCSICKFNEPWRPFFWRWWCEYLDSAAELADRRPGDRRGFVPSGSGYFTGVFPEQCRLLVLLERHGDGHHRELYAW